MNLNRVAAVIFAVTTVFQAAHLQAQALPAAPPESVGMSAQKLGHISEAFKQHIDKGNLPGVVVMVARKGRLVYSDAVGFQNKATGKQYGVVAFNPKDFQMTFWLDEHGHQHPDARRAVDRELTPGARFAEPQPAIIVFGDDANVRAATLVQRLRRVLPTAQRLDVSR